MAEAFLAPFNAYVATAKQDLQGFARFYGDDVVNYAYYHAEPPAAVPEEVWQYIAKVDLDVEEYLDGEEHEELDFAAEDRTACLWWREYQTKFDLQQFKRICTQCCQDLSSHAKLLASFPDLYAVANMPPSYHTWIRLIHRIAENNLVWLGLINKQIIISQRPFDETQKQRVFQSRQPDDPDEPIERDESEVQLIREMQARGKSVPDIWFEYIPYPVVEFHCRMLDVLSGLVQEAHVKEVVRKLGELKLKLVKALGKDKLTTEPLLDKLNREEGTAYGSSGNVKQALADLVKDDGLMKNDGDGYELTEDGHAVVMKLI